MNPTADWLPADPFIEPGQAELHASDASWGCESALPFLWREPVAGEGFRDVPGAPPCPRADAI